MVGAVRRHRAGRARRRAHVAARARHRARLPGQPDRELRRRRPGAGAGDVRHPLDDRERPLRLVARALRRPRDRGRAGRAGGGRHHPPVQPRAAPDPHGRDDRSGAAPRGSFVETSGMDRADRPRGSGTVRRAPYDQPHHVQGHRRRRVRRRAARVRRARGVPARDGRRHRDPRRRRRDRARRRAGHPGPKSPDARLGDRERARVRRRVPPRRHRRAAARRGARAGDPAPRARGSGRRSNGAAPDDRGRGDRARHRRAGRHLALERAGLRRPRALRRRGRRAAPDPRWARRREPDRGGLELAGGPGGPAGPPRAARPARGARREMGYRRARRRRAAPGTGVPLREQDEPRGRDPHLRDHRDLVRRAHRLGR